MSGRELRGLRSPVEAPMLFPGFLSKALYRRLDYMISRVFGCWHLRLSRPITRGTESFQVCLRCGMHRAFDLENWKHTSRFYPPPVERRSDK